MSAKKHAWTEPGAINLEGDARETRMGTAASNPVLSLAPRSQTSTSRISPDGSAAGSERAADHRSPAQIEADIEHTRDRLAVTLDELTERLTPRALLRQANARARGVFVAPRGGVRKDRAAMVAGGLVSVLGGCVALRMLRRD
jgi:hypothetical protein